MKSSRFLTMAIKKFRLISPVGDTVHIETEAGIVLLADPNNKTDAVNIEAAIEEIQDKITAIKNLTINPTYSVEQSLTASVFSLSSAIVDYSFAKFLLSGTTENNLVANGSFENGVANWTMQSGATYSNEQKYSGSYSLKIAQGNQGGSFDISNFIHGHKYYVRAMAFKVTSGLCVIRWQGNDLLVSTTYDKWELINAICTYDSANATKTIQCIINAGVGYFDDVMIIDLTEKFGTGSEPDLAGCHSRYRNWFDGTKSVGPVEIISTGKNLFTPNNLYTNLGNTIINGDTITTTFVNGALHFNTAKKCIKLKSNTQYTIKTFGDTSLVAPYVYRSDGTQIGNYLFTTPPDGLAAICVAGSGAYGLATYQIMLVEGTTSPTSFESYVETTKLINIPSTLNKVGNLSDTLDLLSGKIIKNVGSKILQTTDVIDMITTYVNIDYARITKPSDAKNATNYGDARTEIILDGYMSGYDTSWDLATHIGSIYANPDTTRYWIGVTKGTSLATAQAALAGKTLYYQLAAPVPSLTQSKDLTARPSGSIQILNRYEDYDFYNYGAFVTNTKYPIKSLLAVSKFDLETGVETPVAVSTCTVASDGLSFTSTAISNQELVWFKAEYADGLSSVPTTNYTYITNLKAMLYESAMADKRIDDKIDKTNQQVRVLGQHVDRLNDEILNPSYSVLNTISASTFSLSSAVIDYNFSDFILKGNSITNMLQSIGNFEVDSNSDGLADGWSGINHSSAALDGADYLFGSKSQRLHPFENASISGSCGVFKDLTSIANGDKIYLSLYVKVNDKTKFGNTYIGRYTTGWGNGESIIATTFVASERWEKLSIVFTWDSARPRLALTVMGAGSNTTADHINFDGIMMVNLTQLGLTSLTKAQCDAYMEFVDDTKSVGPLEILTTGKNLFDKSIYTKGYYIAPTTGILAASVTYFVSDFIRIPKGATLKVSGTNTTGGNDYCYYDINKNFLGGFSLTNNPTLTPLAGAEYIRFDGPLSYLDTCQLEVGSSATTYEAFSKSSEMINLLSTLKSIGLSSDTLDTISGKLTTCIDSKVLQSSDLTAAIYTGYPNLDYALIPKPTTSKGYGNIQGYGDVAGSVYLLEGYPEIMTDYASVTNVGSFGSRADSSYIFFGVTKGTTLVQAQAILVGKTLSYQLINPVITYIQSQILTSKPFGSVNIFTRFEDYDFYNNGAFVTKIAYPIKNLLAVSKFNTDTGEETVVDISTCTIASDGLSFTSTAIGTGELVWFKADYSSALSAIPTTTYGYVTNVKAGMAEAADNDRLLDGKIDQANRKLEKLTEQVYEPLYINLQTANTSIFSLSAGIIDYKFSDFIIYGSTISDVFGTSGSFRTDSNKDGVADGWNKSTDPNAVATFTPGVQKVKNAVGGLFQSMYGGIYAPASAGDKIYVRALIKPITGTLANKKIGILCHKADVDKTYLTFQNVGSPAVLGASQIISGIITTSADTGLILPTYYSTYGTAEAYEDDLLFFMTLNLTKMYGAGSEPVVTDCDKWFNFTSGARSIGPMEILSTGKNIFDGSEFTKGQVTGGYEPTAVSFVDNTLSIVASGNANNIASYKKVYKAGTTLYIKYSRNNANLSMRLNDITETTYQVLNPDILTTVVLTKDTIIDFQFGGTPAAGTIGKATDIMVSTSTFTAYELYTKSASLINLSSDLKSIGTAKDEYNILTGRILRNISEWVILDGSLAWAYSTAYTGCKRVAIAGFNSYGYDTHLVIKYNGILLTYGDTAPDGAVMYSKTSMHIVISNTDSGWPDSITPSGAEISAYFYGWKMCNSDGSVPYSGSGTKYWKKITDGTGLTSVLPNASYSGYIPYKMIYQLVTPVVSYTQPQIFEARPSGIVQILNRYEDYDFYTSAAFITKTSYYIKSLLAVSKFDLETGTEIPIDISTCTVSSDGFSFTSTTLTAGDLVWFKVEYLENPIPTIKYSHASTVRAGMEESAQNDRKLDDKIDESNRKIILIGNQVDKLVDSTYSALQSANTSVFSLMSDIIDYKFNSFIVYGSNDVNAVINSNFVGTTGWVAASATLSASNNVISITGDGIQSYPYAYQDTKVTCAAGKKIFVKMKAKVTNAVCSQIQLAIGGTTSGSWPSLVTTSPIQNAVYEISGIVTLTDQVGSVRIELMHTYASAAAASGMVMEVKEVMMIDLTDRFGAGNEPSLAACQSRYYKWFGGVQSVGPLEVVSTSKNLLKLPKSGSATAYGVTVSIDEDGYITLDGTATEYMDIRFSHSIKAAWGSVAYETPSILLEIGTPHVISLKDITGSNTGSTPEFYGRNEDGGVGTITYQFHVEVTNPKQFIPTLPIRYIGAYIAPGTVFSKFRFRMMIEKGTVASPQFIPYEESHIYDTLDKKRVGSVMDEIDYLKGEFIQRISDWVTLDGRYAWSVGEKVGYKYFTANVLTAGIGVPNKELVVKYNGTRLSSSLAISTNDQSILDVGTAMYISVLDTETGFPEDYTPTAGDIKAYFYGWKLCASDGTAYVSGTKYWKKITNGTGITSVLPTKSYIGYTPYKLCYQLVSPITKKIEAQTLRALPSGSIQIYNRYEDYDFYNSKVTITKSDYPIKSIISISKFNTSTGEETTLDPLLCTVAADGLTFTSTELTNGDLVWFKVEYKESGIPTVDYTYVTSVRAGLNEASRADKILDEKIENTNQRVMVLSDQALNPSYTALTELTQSIFSVQSEAINYQFKEFIIKGNTETNIATNGNMATSWSSANATTSAANNILTVTASVSGGYAYSSNINIISGHRYFMSAMIKAASNLVQMSMGGVPKTYHSGSNQYERIATIFTPSADATTNIRFTDDRTSGWDAFYVKEAICIDLTARFGAGNEPLIDECKLKYPHWFDGTRSVGPLEVVTTGRNLLDKARLTKGWYVLPTGGISPTAGFNASDFIKIIPNTNYYIIKGCASENVHCWYDINKNFISAYTLVKAGTAVTSPANAYYTRITVDDADIDTCQVEPGLKSTAYEPYNETLSYSNFDLRNIGNVFDKVDVLMGKMFKTISSFTFTNLATWTVGFSLTNTKLYYKANVVSDALTPLANATACNIKVSIGGAEFRLASSFSLDLQTSDTEGVYLSSDNELMVRLNNSRLTSYTGTDTQKFEQWLQANSPAILYYQLSTPVSIEILPQSPIAYSGGTIQVNPGIADYDLYNSGIYITNTSYPIKSLKKVVKVDKLTGVETEVKVSTCTIAGNGLSFTSTAISAGELIWFVYYYDTSLSVVPTCSYQLDTNLKAQVAENSKSIGYLSKAIGRVKELVSAKIGHNLATAANDFLVASGAGEFVKKTLDEVKVIIGNASQTVAGLMSAADKTKLDSVATGATNYTHPANHAPSIITQDTNNRFVTDAEKSTWNAKASTAVATTGANGLMSAGDKSKLDGIAAGATNYVHPANHAPSIITQDANNRFVTDAEKSTWNGKQNALSGDVGSHYHSADRIGNGRIRGLFAMQGSAPVFGWSSGSSTGYLGSLYNTLTSTSYDAYTMAMDTTSVYNPGSQSDPSQTGQAPHGTIAILDDGRVGIIKMVRADQGSGYYKFNLVWTEIYNFGLALSGVTTAPLAGRSATNSDVAVTPSGWTYDSSGSYAGRYYGYYYPVILVTTLSGAIYSLRYVNSAWTAKLELSL